MYCYIATTTVDDDDENDNKNGMEKILFLVQNVNKSVSKAPSIISVCHLLDSVMFIHSSCMCLFEFIFPFFI